MVLGCCLVLLNHFYTSYIYCTYIQFFYILVLCMTCADLTLAHMLSRRRTAERNYMLHGKGALVQRSEGGRHDFRAWLPADEQLQGVTSQRVRMLLKGLLRDDHDFSNNDVSVMDVYVHESFSHNDQGISLAHSHSHTRERSRSSKTVIVKHTGEEVGQDPTDHVCHVLFYVRCVPPLLGAARTSADEKRVQRYAICQSYLHPKREYPPHVKTDMALPRHVKANQGVRSVGCVLSHADFGVCYLFDKVFKSPLPTATGVLPSLNVDKTYRDNVWPVPVDHIERMVAISESYPRRGAGGVNAKTVRCVGVPHSFRSG